LPPRDSGVFSTSHRQSADFVRAAQGSNAGLPMCYETLKGADESLPSNARGLWLVNLWCRS
jgi:hypothetical protein